MSNAVYDSLTLLKPAPIDPYQVRPIAVRSAIPATCLSWVTLDGSMTRAISQRFGETPTVAPSHEGPDRLARWEAHLLKPGARRGYARHVTLAVNGVPVLQARTMSLQGDPAVEVLRRLSNRPLAEVLFRDRRWRRLREPLPLLDRRSQRIGRACVWQFGLRTGSQILVEEYFLPALLEPQSG